MIERSKNLHAYRDALHVYDTAGIPDNIQGIGEPASTAHSNMI